MKKTILLSLLAFCCLFSATTFGQNHALQFDGVNDKVVIADNSVLNPTSAITVEAWIYANSWKPQIWAGTIVGKQVGSPDRGYCLTVGEGGKAEFTVAIDNSWQKATSPAVLTLAAWHHVAGVYDGTTISIYINGVLQNSTPYTGTIDASTGTDLNIGENPTWSGRVFNGRIDEVRIWNIARSQTEIFDNMTVNIDPATTGLMGYWKFDDATGATLTDATPNANHGTLTNMDTDNAWVAGFFIPSCIAPSNIVFSNVTSTQATATWSGDVSANYNIEYKTMAASTWLSTSSSTNTVDLSALSASSSYQMRVQKDCGAGDLSEWSNIATFNTLCDVITVFPYEENFSLVDFPNCWSEVRTPESTYGWISHANGQSGRGMRFDSYNNDEDNISLLKSPVLNISSLTSAELSFWWKNPTGGNFKVLLSTDGGATFPNVLADNLTNQTSWTESTYNISSFISSGTQIVIGFEATSNWGYGDAYVYLDGVSIEEMATCLIPTNLLASNASTSSINLSWDGTADNFRVQYKKSTETTWTYTSLISTNNTLLDNLEEASLYEIQVRAICASNDSSLLSPIVFASTTQNPANTPYIIDFESGATSWSFVNGNETNAWIHGNATSNGGSNSVYVSNDQQNNAYSITTSSISHIYRDIHFAETTVGYTLNFDWKCEGEEGYDYMKVYLIDVTEQPIAGTELSNGAIGEEEYSDNSTWITETINIPASVSNTTKRLVFTWINDNSVGTTPAAIDNISITETVILPCEMPTALNASNITQTTAQLNWTSAAANFEIRHRATGQTTWIENTASVNSLNITALTPNTEYEFQVKAICSNLTGDQSEWTASELFTSLDVASSCDVPSSLVVSAMGGNGATLNWTAGGSETSWNVRYKASSATTYTIVNDASKPYIVSGLAPSTAYVWNVQAVCNPSLSSDWSTEGTFMTTVGIADNSYELSIFANNGVINIVNNNALHIKEIALYDLIGKKIAQYQINSAENVFINTSIPAGHYIIRLTAENHIITEKLFVK